MFEALARRELHSASRLYNEFCTGHDGWTLDIGAGSGGVWLFSLPPNKLIALDFAPLLAPPDKYTFRLTGDASNLPFSEGTFSTILALGLLEYVNDLELTLGDWRKACKPGALMLLTNSPPILPNRIRKWLRLGAIPRADSQIEEILIRQGWRVIENSRRRSGWQSMLVAEAVFLLGNT